MPRLVWDAVGERVFETGVDRGVLYTPDAGGAYSSGVPWNGLTTVTESPSGAEATPQYADNIKYLNLVSAEDFAATVEALTYPKEFEQFDGSVTLNNGGLRLGQQPRKPFGLSYRTKVGNDVAGQDLGYKLHLVYGCLAAPSERAYATVNDSPEPLALSWELSTTPVAVTGQKPTALITADSTKLSAAGMVALENALWGTTGTSPRLPTPDEVIAMFAGTLVNVVVPVAVPTYTAGTRTVTLPAHTGVDWYVNGTKTTGTYVIPTGQYAVVKAVPAAGYTWPTNVPVQDTWVFGPAA